VGDRLNMKAKTKKKDVKDYYFYKGFTIFRNTEPGFKLKYTCGILSSDTLKGIKNLIKNR
jgi:hypothetical protein